MTNRREFLAGALGGMLAATSAGVSNAGPAPHNFVLVHGTWHGGWVWRDVADRLRDSGHRVITPTCTGCGEREHLATPATGLDTHVTDVEQAIRYAEFDRFVLVGHSFAGLTITGVADRLRDRVQRVVFFDALVPRPGRMRGVPVDPVTGEFPDWWHERRKRFHDGWRMVFWKEYPVEMLVPPTMTEQVARLRRLITTHPAKQWTDELVLENGGWDGLRRAYVHCVGQEYRMSSDAMVGPARGSGWDFVELDTPRNGMMTHPDLVTDTLIGLA